MCMLQGESRQAYFSTLLLCAIACRRNIASCHLLFQFLFLAQVFLKNTPSYLLLLILCVWYYYYYCNCYFYYMYVWGDYYYYYILLQTNSSRRWLRACPWCATAWGRTATWPTRSSPAGPGSGSGSATLTPRAGWPWWMCLPGNLSIYLFIYLSI